MISMQADAKRSGLLEYVEIRTKITSVFSFIITLAYLAFQHRPLDPLRSGLFFAGMLLFDLTATAINNYVDLESNPQGLSLSPGKARGVMLTLLALSVACGLGLAALTDIVVLLAGALCFCFGILYSWGPLPLSHSPLGEAASGFFYGVMIPFILFQINDPGYLLTYGFSPAQISVSLNVVPLVGFALLAILPFCLTAAIMLANNLCDVDRDIQAGRHTLAFYLKDRALLLFDGLYYAAYLSVAVMVLLRFLPVLSLALLLTLVPVRRNLKLFRQKQAKEGTFSVSIRNFILISSAHAVLIFLGGLLQARSIP